MNAYSLALFLHIVGTLGIYLALGLEWTGLRHIGGATLAEPARAWMGTLKSTQKVGFVSMLATVITGIYMMVKAPDVRAWIFVSVGALVLVIVLAVALTGPRMAAVGRALAFEKGSVSSALHSLANHRLLWISIQTRLAIALAIVFLMIAKLDLGGSLLTIGIAIVLGLASALPMPRSGQAHEASGD
jgi:hypothetical protein